MATVNRPPFWVPRPPDDNIWSLQLQRSQALTLATTEVKSFGAPGQVPTKRWLPQYTLNDPPEWQGAPVHSQSLVLTTTELEWYAAPGQVPTKRWLPQYTQDDPPPWQFPTNWMDSAAIQVLTQQHVFGAGGQVPTKGWSPYLWDDPSAVWQFQTEWMNAAAIVQLTSHKVFGQGGQVPPARWNFNYDETGQWQWTLQERNPNLLTVSAAQNPFIPVPWSFNYDETPAWNAQPVATNIEFIPTNVPRAAFYALKSGEEYFWQPAVQHNVNLFPPGPASQPFLPVPWRFNYDETPSWQLTTRSLVQLLTISGKPFVPYFWNFNYDETGPVEFWKPYATNTTFTLSSFALYAPRNNWDEWFAEVDDPPTWQWVYNRNINVNTGPAAPAPGVPRIWSFCTYSDDVGWIGQPVASNLRFIPQLPPVNVLNVYRWWFNYDQDPMWQGKPLPGLLVNVPIPPVVGPGVYNTMLLCIPNGMFAIPGNPPS